MSRERMTLHPKPLGMPWRPLNTIYLTSQAQLIHSSVWASPRISNHDSWTCLQCNPSQGLLTMFVSVYILALFITVILESKSIDWLGRIIFMILPTRFEWIGANSINLLTSNNKALNFRMQQNIVTSYIYLCTVFSARSSPDPLEITVDPIPNIFSVYPLYFRSPVNIQRFVIFPVEHSPSWVLERSSWISCSLVSGAVLSDSHCLKKPVRLFIEL